MMTNYPAELAPSWREYPVLEALKIFRLAISFTTWSPREWALYHDVAVDLPSAWWMACHAWNFVKHED